jgi:hypothetical protein
MAEPEPHTTEGMANETVELELNRDDYQLVLTALRVLLSTLGREEADELEQVRALLGQLERQVR